MASFGHHAILRGPTCFDAQQWKQVILVDQLNARRINRRKYNFMLSDDRQLSCSCLCRTPYPREIRMKPVMPILVQVQRERNRTNSPPTAETLSPIGHAIRRRRLQGIDRCVILKLQIAESIASRSDLWPMGGSAYYYDCAQRHRQQARPRYLVIRWPERSLNSWTSPL